MKSYRFSEGSVTKTATESGVCPGTGTTPRQRHHDAACIDPTAFAGCNEDGRGAELGDAAHVIPMGVRQ